MYDPVVHDATVDPTLEVYLFALFLLLIIENWKVWG
jgi:hypothetical protein